MKKYVVIFFVIVFVALLFICNIIFASLYPVKYKNLIIENSKNFNLSASLVASVINVESSYKENSVSSKDAIGLMQIKLSTANYLNDFYNLNISLTKEDLLKPENNIYYGCMYLKYLKTKFENEKTILAAYNAGETKVRSWLNNSEYSSDGKTLKYIPYQETRKYIEKIQKNIKIYRKIYK